MINHVIGRRYAKALIEIGLETRTLEALVRDFDAISELYTGSDELRHVLENPQVPATARKAVMGEIAQRLGLSQVTQNTLGLLSDSRRLQALPAIAQALREQADAQAGIVRAHVKSAAPLTETYARRLTQALESRFQKRIVLQREVDPSLIAGVVTRVGDLVIDGSLRSRLADLKAQLQRP